MYLPQIEDTNRLHDSLASFSGAQALINSLINSIDEQTKTLFKIQYHVFSLASLNESKELVITNAIAHTESVELPSLRIQYEARIGSDGRRSLRSLSF